MPTSGEAKGYDGRVRRKTATSTDERDEPDEADGEQSPRCPWCGEPADVWVDEGGGDHQRYVEDCAVCCRPCVITVEPGELHDRPVVRIDRE